MDKFEGIIFYRKKYRERDLLVKILTDEYGKRTFFINKGSVKNNRFSAGLKDFTIGTYEGRISNLGFSFINEIVQEKIFVKIYYDLDGSSYTKYIFSLVDSAFKDNRNIKSWFNLVLSAINYINEGIDPELLSHAFELKLLQPFGVELDLFSCKICGRRDLPLDLSFKYDGVICSNHFNKDELRFHLSDRQMRALQILLVASLSSIVKMHIDKNNMLVIRKVCDDIYDNYVGLNSKAKSFIDKIRNES